MRGPCTQLESSPHSPQLEKVCMYQQRPSAAKKNKQQLKPLIHRRLEVHLDTVSWTPLFQPGNYLHPQGPPDGIPVQPSLPWDAF